MTERSPAFSLADPLRERGKVGVVGYGGEGVRIGCKLTDNQRTLKEAFARLKAGGISPMGTAIFLADQELLREEKALKAIVLFSDGHSSNPESVIHCVNQARERGVRFITVEVGPKADFDFLRRIASHPEDCHLLPAKGRVEEKARQILAGLSEKGSLSPTTQNPLLHESAEFLLYNQDEGREPFILLPDGQLLWEEDQQRSEEQGIHAGFMARNVTEQRRRLRVSVSLKVDYKYGDVWATGQIGNISESGIFLLTDSLIRPGEELLLQFLPSDLPLSRPIRVIGEVTRAVELDPQVEGRGTWSIGLGIQFKNIHSQSKSDFVQYTKKLTEGLASRKTEHGAPAASPGMAIEALTEQGQITQPEEPPEKVRL